MVAVKDVHFFLNTKLEIMFKTNQSGRLMVDEIKVEAQLLRNKIADIIEEVYVTEVKSLVHDELQKRCDGCEMDDLLNYTMIA